MQDRKRRSKTENGIFLSGFFDQKKKVILSDFANFRAAFLFSIATSYRDWGDFRLEKMAIEKYCATRYQGVCMAHSQKKENTAETRQHAHQSTKAQTTKAHESIRRHDS